MLDLYLEKFYTREMYPVPVTFMGRGGGGFASYASQSGRRIRLGYIKMTEIRKKMARRR